VIDNFPAASSNPASLNLAVLVAALQHGRQAETDSIDLF
jgi:hypothetical protein